MIEPGNFRLFSQMSAKEFKNSRLFCMHLVNYNSCSSVFSAQQPERISTGNHHVIIFIISPGQLVPAETEHCAETPQTTQWIGQGCTSARLLLHTLHEHPSFSSKAKPAFKTYETWLRCPMRCPMSTFFHSGNFGEPLPPNKN